MLSQFGPLHLIHCLHQNVLNREIIFYAIKKKKLNLKKRINCDDRTMIMDSSRPLFAGLDALPGRSAEDGGIGGHRYV